MKPTPTPVPPIETPQVQGDGLALKRMIMTKGFDPASLAGMVMYGAPGHATHLAGQPVPETPPKSEQN